MISTNNFGNSVTRTGSHVIENYNDCVLISDQGGTIVIEKVHLAKFLEALAVMYPAELKQALGLTRLRIE